METGDNMAAAKWFVNNEIISLVQIQDREVNGGCCFGGEVAWWASPLRSPSTLSNLRAGLNQSQNPPTSPTVTTISAQTSVLAVPPHSPSPQRSPNNSQKSK